MGSEHLLTAIEKEAAKAGIVQNVLLEVNIGGEESKSGVSPEALVGPCWMPLPHRSTSGSRA